MDYFVFFGLIALIALTGVRELLGRRALRWVERACELNAEGRQADAMRWTTLALWVAPGPVRFAAQFLRMNIYSDRGETEKAVGLAQSTLKFLRQTQLNASPWPVINGVVVTLINGGLYGEALEAMRDWPNEPEAPGSTDDAQYVVLARINEAEALCNCARIDEALSKLDDVREAAGQWPLALAGLILLRAWVLLQAGHVVDARDTLENVDMTALDPLYTAEVEYTRAALERDSGQLELAMELAERGLAAARRASSYRNGLFMIAGIAALRGDHERAHRLFEEGGNARYRAQAGEGLNRYARFLDSIGDHAKASRVRTWIATRDPEWKDPLTDSSAGSVA